MLGVEDLDASRDYYVNVLGFDLDFSVDGWAFLSFGDFRLMVGHCPGQLPVSETQDHAYFACVTVEDIDDIYQEFKDNGAAFRQDIADKPWGLRQFEVITPDGHRIVFVQEI